MTNKPSPVVIRISGGEMDEEDRQQLLINKLWVGMAQAGNKRYRQQVVQDIAWHLRSGHPLPIELHDYLLEALDMMADGDTPSEAFPTVEKKMRVDRVERFVLFAKIENLRKSEDLPLTKALDQLATVPHTVKKLDGSLKAKDYIDPDLRSKLEKGYEREKKLYNALSNKYQQVIDNFTAND